MCIHLLRSVVLRRNQTILQLLGKHFDLYFRQIKALPVNGGAVQRANTHWIVHFYFLYHLTAHTNTSASASVMLYIDGIDIALTKAPGLAIDGIF